MIRSLTWLRRMWRLAWGWYSLSWGFCPACYDNNKGSTACPVCRGRTAARSEAEKGAWWKRYQEIVRADLA